MIVGTSTGGLIAFGLVGGNCDENGNRFPMTLEECILMYKKKTKKIFTKSWKKWALSWIPGLNNVPLTPYPTDHLKEVLQEYFTDSSLADFSKSKAIAGAVTRQIGKNEQLVLFDTGTDAYKLYKTYQVLLATSNAPVYFDTPIKIGDKQFVDGGVGGNCPLAQAIPRARRIFGEKAKITTAFSIAPPPTAESQDPASYQLKYWLNYFVELSTNGYCTYVDAKQCHSDVIFRRLFPRGESLKIFKLDEIDAEKMLQAMENEKQNDEMFLVDIIAMAAFVVYTYLGKQDDEPKTSRAMAAKLAYTAGKMYSGQLEYELAYASFETSLNLSKELAGEENKVTCAEIYENMAVCLSSQGKYQQAYKYFNLSIKTYPDVVNKASACLKLAECYLLDSRYNDARAALELVLKLQRGIHGENEADPEVACTLNRLGWCYRELGNYEEAKNYYLQSYEMRKKLYPSGDHWDVAESLNSLALGFDVLGKYDDAVRYAERSLKMRQNLTETANDERVAESLNNLGWCLLSKSEYEKAQENLEMALKMKNALYEEKDHCSTAITLENLAKCLLHTKDDPGAVLEYAQQAFNMKKECFGYVINGQIAKTLQIIGLCFEKAGNYKNATEYYMYSMHIIRRILNRNHPKLIEIYRNLGNSLNMQKEYEKAKHYLKLSNEIKKTDKTAKPADS